MTDLFDAATSRSFLTRLDALQPASKPLWGKMTVTQMLAHCQVPLKSAVGEVRIPRSFIGRLLGSIAKRKVLGPEPFERNLPTDPRFLIPEPAAFAEEKRRLADVIRKFSVGPTALTGEPHPFFGRLEPAQWSALMAKHLDHHFRQFGV